MTHWLLLATWWRKDGTPVPDRRFFNLLFQGDPSALAYLCLVVALLAGPAMWRAIVRR
jgi:hypothetical protein